MTNVKLPARLKQLRDVDRRYGYEDMSGTVTPKTYYTQGFDACAAELLPQLEKMAEALRDIEWHGETIGKCECRTDIARNSLTAYSDWLDGTKENKKTLDK